MKKALVYALFGAIVAIILLGSLYGHERNERSSAEQNVEALSDSLRITNRLKNGLVYEKKSLLIDAANLKTVNNTLYQDVEYWKKKKQEVNVVTSVKVVYRDTGSTKTVLTKISDNWYLSSFDYLSTDSSVRVTGFNELYFYPKILNADSNKVAINPKVGRTTLSKIEVSMNIKLGIKTDKKGVQSAYAITDNDAVHIQSLDAAVIDKSLNSKRSRLSLGITAGYGILYDIKANSLHDGIALAGGLTFNIFR